MFKSAAVLLLACVAINAQTYPDGCTTSSSVTCSRGYYVLPDGFDVNAFYETITRLQIWGDNNVVNPGKAVPLPYRKSLTNVGFWNFNNALDSARFPLNQLLVHNTAHIKRLVLSNVKLLSLTASDFSGFNQLAELIVLWASLTSVHPTTFTELGLLASGVIDPSYQSALLSLDLSGNADLTSLDWSVLKAVSQNLKELRMSSNGFTNLFSSSPFPLSSASLIILTDTKIRRLPAEVYGTLNSSLKLDIQLSGEPFCPTDTAYDCGCCEMQEFSQWLRENNQEDAVTSIQCNKNRPVTSAQFLAQQDLHSHCPAISPKTTTAATNSRTTTAQPAVTTKATPVPCNCADDSVVTVRCSKGVVTLPTAALGDLEVNTRAEFIGDDSKKCGIISYGLHEWLLVKSGIAKRSRFGVRAVSGADVVMASCSGRGLISVNEHNPDTVESSSVIVEAARTKKCQEFLFDFLTELLAV